MSMTERSFGTDFGQKVDLTASIRGILRNYPEGTAILKEFIQNADDARAKRISFCLDYRTHGTLHLAGPRLADYQGPALLVFNDALFSPDDMQSIQRIGDSIKNSQSKQAKIGRFGIGFNAIYHWTDFPSFLTGRNLVYLDPQASILPNVNPSNPGKLVDWMQDFQLLNIFQDQFVPFEGFEQFRFADRQMFPGTLFRCPLRTEIQASTSLLSKRLVTTKEVLKVLLTLRNEASKILLFLRYVQELSISVWTPGAVEPQVLFTTSAMNMTASVSEKRVGFLDMNRSPSIAQFDYSMIIRCIDNCVTIENDQQIIDDESVFSNYSVFENASQISSQLVYDERWEICNQYGSSDANRIAFDPNNSHLRLVPWGGVAGMVSSSRNIVEIRNNDHGIAYCFLPLPIDTKLPVMVNGFFELSSNRRDVWMSSSDMTGDGVRRAQWNKSLMEQLIASCYIRLLHRFKVSVGWSEAYMEKWPKLASTPYPWNLVAESVYQLSRIEPLLQPLLKNNSLNPIWINCKDAVIFPDSDLDNTTIVNILVDSDVRVIDCVADLKQSLVNGRAVDTIVDPPFVRNLLRLKKPKLTSSKLCSDLFSYCIIDIDVTSPNSLIELDKLPVLPIGIGVERSGIFRVFTTVQLQAIKTLQSMGFGLIKSIDALEKTKFVVDVACDNLLTNEANQRSNDIVYFFTEEDKGIFQTSFDILVNDTVISESLKLFLKNENVQQCSNVKIFNDQYLLEIFSYIFPDIALSGRPLNLKDLPSDIRNSFPSIIESLWKFLVKNSGVIDSVANNASIVPTMNGDFFSLSKDSAVLIPQQANITLNEKMIELLSNAGVRLAFPSLWKDMILPKQIWNYLYFPSRQGVLGVLGQILLMNNDGIIQSFTNLPSHQKEYFLECLFVSEPIQQLTESDCQTIRRLPIFPLYEENKYVSLDSRSFKFVINDRRLSRNFMDSSFIKSGGNPNQTQLYTRLGIKGISRSEYFLEHFLVQRYDNARNNIKAYLSNVAVMLLEWNSLQDENNNFLGSLADIDFIPSDYDVEKGEYRQLWKASDLFDPSIDDFKDLIGDDVLPARDICREDIIVCLRQLGLQQSMKWPTIVAIAKGIERQYLSTMNSNDNAVESLYVRATNLLSYLDSNIGNLLNTEKKPSRFRLGQKFIRSFFTRSQEDGDLIEQSISELRNVIWIPVLSEPSEVGIPWLYNDDDEMKTYFAAPSNCRHLSQGWYCSATKRLFDFNVKSTALMKVLHWDDPIDAVTAAIQLKEISKVFTSLDDRTNSGFDGDILVQLRLRIASIIPSLYEILNAAGNQSDFVVNTLKDINWVWIGDKFVHCDKLAYSTTINAQPYLYRLPQDIKLYSKLLEGFHIKQQFVAFDYVSALSNMANEYRDQSLDDAACQLAVSLVSVVSGDRNLSSISLPIYIPDRDSRLTMASQLVCDDVPWLSGKEHEMIRSGCRFIHPNISFQVAMGVGVNSLRSILVQQSIKHDIFPQHNLSDNIAAYGQTESLTSRLKGILDLYPDGNPIISELIQNADDSGAKLMRVVVDYNFYGTESLLDRNLAELQGPSLLVYNDARFTEDDFKALAKIGQASKIDRVNATGRFGLGFSSTYHWTDTPSFVSGDYMVVLDPHCSFVPGASLNQPGIRVKFVDSLLPVTFLDQFEPFKYFDCDFKSSYNGTLFRFPFRLPSQVKKSEISKRSYTPDDMERILKTFTDQICECLIFLRNIKTIEVYERRKGCQPSLICKTVAADKELSRTGDQSLLYQLQQRERLSSRDEFYSNMLKLPNDQFPRYCCIRDIEVHLIKQSSEPIVKEFHQYSYLMVIGMEGGFAKEMAADDTNRHLKLIPYGGVALCLQHSLLDELGISVNQELPTLQGGIFCFLPLPIQSALPVHINAYWELSSNRRDIWRGADFSGEAKRRSDWNKVIIENIIPSLYVNALKLLLKMNTFDKNNISNFYCKLPCPIPPEPWNSLGRSVLWMLSKENIFLSVNGKFVTCEEAIFFSVKKDSDEDEILQKIMSLEQFSLVVVSSAVHSAFKENNRALKDVSPNLVREWFNISNPKSMTKGKCILWESQWASNTAEYAKFLLSYCSRDINRSNYKLLLGVALLLLHGSKLGVIGKPSDPPVYIVSDVECRILKVGSYQLILSEEYSGSNILSVLKDPLFSEISNIKVLSSNLFIDLIEDILVTKLESWSKRTVNIGAIVSDDWLREFWNYTVDKKLLSSFRDRFPLLPVLDPNGSNTLMTVKVSIDIPVLNMNAGELPPIILTLLGRLGVFVVNAKLLGSICYSEDLSSILLQPNTQGIITALAVVCQSGQVTENIVSWEASEIDVFRDYLLDSVISQSNNLRYQDISTLSMLPVWKTMTRGFKNSSYHPISNTIVIAPKAVNTAALNDKFIHLRNDNDRKLYKVLGLVELSDGEFYRDHFIPDVQSGNISDSWIDDICIDILRKLSHLEVECPGISKLLGSIPLIRSEMGIILPASNMYDPAQTDITSLLPTNSFPMTSLFKGYLIPLRELGLRVKLDSAAILLAARTINQDFVRYITEKTENSTGSVIVEDVIRKSCKLLEYVDIHIETLLIEVDMEGVSRELQTIPSESNKSPMLGKEWSAELRSLQWIPVHTSPPKSLEGLSWPSRLHFAPLAAPSQCCQTSDIWLLSSTHRIPCMDINRDLTKRILGWNKPASGRCLAIQLCAISDVTSTDITKDTVRLSIQSNISSIYKALYHAFKNESESEIREWMNVLRGKSIIWTNESFVDCRRLSFTSLISTDMRPHLHILNSEYITYKDMFRALGVRETFEPQDLMELIRQLKAEYDRDTLPFDKFNLVIGVLNMVVQLLHQSITTEPNDNQVQSNKLKMSDLGTIYLPDVKHVLERADKLFVNDAKWLDSSIGGHQHFVCKEIGLENALMFGCLSYRDHLFSGQNVICPTPMHLSKLLVNDTLESAIMDVFRYADALGATNFQVYYDETKYGCDSVMYPTLASTQGPSLLFWIDGPTLSTEAITRDINITKIVNIDASYVQSIQENKIVVGNKLSATFAFGNFVQFISGKYMWMFDPLGNFLPSHEVKAETQNSTNTPSSRAWRYDLFHLSADIEDNDLISQFPHQFEPFLSIKCNGSSNLSLRQPIPGIFIRIPLRYEPSSIFALVADSNMFKNCWKTMMDKMKGSIVFSDSIIEAAMFNRTYNSFDTSKADPELLYQISLLQPFDKRNQRKSLTLDKSWRKSTFPSLFSKPYTPLDVSYSIRLSCIVKERNVSGETIEVKQSTELWVLWNIFGHDYIRQEALQEPFLSLNIQPLVTIACPYDQQDDLSSAPQSCYLFNGSTPMWLTGLPFHIDAFFLKPTDAILENFGKKISHGSVLGLQQMLRPPKKDFDFEASRIWNLGLLLTAVEVLIPKALNDIRTKLITDFHRLKNDQSTIQLVSLYKYWPYIPRMESIIRETIVSSSLYANLAVSSLFLVRNDFVSVRQSILCTTRLTSSLRDYLEKLLPLSKSPTQVTIDLSKFKISGLVTLKPEIVREALKQIKNRSQYPSKDILVSLFRYVTSDVLPLMTDADNARIRLLKSLIGCPLILMADNSIKPFSDNIRQRYILAPLSVHVFLPQLHSMLIHPVYSKLSRMIEDSSFSSVMNIEIFNTNVIINYLPYFIPEGWSRSLAVNWPVELSTFEPLLFSLWREILGQEASLSAFEALRSYPLVPIVSNGRRLLLSMDLISFIIICDPTEFMISRFAELNESVENLVSKADTAYRENFDDSVTEYDAMDNTPWMSLSCSNAINDGAINPSIVPSVDDAASQPDSNNVPISITSTTVHSRDVSNTLRPEINDIITRIGLPVLDRSLISQIPRVMCNGDFDAGRKILNSMYMCLYYGNQIHDSLGSANSILLNTSMLSANDRKLLILEILKSHRDKELTPTDTKKLKSLPLFTKIDGQATSVSDYQSIYWCRDDSILRSVNEPMNNTNQAEVPIDADEFRNQNDFSFIFLEADPGLLSVYSLIGAEELTPSKSANKFILPVLKMLKGEKLTNRMLSLASNWGTYCNDETFKTAIKDIQFIPSWSRSNQNVDYVNMRSSSSTLSWLNADLSNMLSTFDYENYYPPLFMQQAEYFPMLSDLGMKDDISKEILVVIASDLQQSWATCQGKVSANAELIDKIFDRATRLLRYLNDNDRFTSLVHLDNRFAGVISDIKFIPIQVPIRVESGGYVVFKRDIVRYRDVTTKNFGSVCFTLIPVLSDDICPPQMFQSALGIISNISDDTVIRHVNALVSNNDVLDRWNVDYLYSVHQVFSAIFAYLNDHWKRIPNQIKSHLKTLSIIPISNHLVKAERAFFKLSLDLSPFLFEVPLHFGAHEQFLKKIGVRTSPSIEDYLQILAELAYESKNQSLNANELRAVKSILEIMLKDEGLRDISNQAIDISIYLADKVVYVPDEAGVLRKSNRMLYNDNNWLRSQIASLDSFDLYIVHPWIDYDIAKILRIVKLGDAIHEKLEYDDSLMVTIEKNKSDIIAEKLKYSLSTNEVIESLSSVMMYQTLSNQSSSSTKPVIHIGPQAIRNMMESVQISIVPDLKCTFSLKHQYFIGHKEVLFPKNFPTLSYLFTVDNNKYILINQSALSSTITPETALGVGLCELFQLPASYASIMSTILITDRERLNIVLSSLQIGSNMSMRERLRGLPGELLTSLDVSLLQLKPFKTFQIGEIVAIRALSVANDLYSVESHDASFIYGKVIGIGDESEAGLRKILIRTGTTSETKLSSEVYSFRSSFNKPSDDSGNRVTSSTNTTNSTSKTTIDQSIKRSSSVLSVEANSPSGLPSNHVSTSVSSEDVVEALQSLLVRAGIPPDFEKKSMSSKILELESLSESLTRQLNFERTQLSSTREQLQSMTDAMKCPICTEKKVDNVVNPCGHTFCGGCLRKLNQNQCPLCRRAIRDTVKFYLASVDSNDTVDL